MRDSDITSLHPIMRPMVGRLQQMLSAGYLTGATLTEFVLFETYRSPEAQDECYKLKTSKAKAWQSAHQYGLAADFVPRIKGAWDWSDYHDWTYLKSCALRCGLRVPILWDRPHVEHPDWELAKARIRRQ